MKKIHSLLPFTSEAGTMNLTQHEEAYMIYQGLDGAS
jgi:hypothetical protein